MRTTSWLFYVGLLAPFFVVSFCLLSPGMTAPMYFDSGARVGANAYLFGRAGLWEVINAFPQRPIPMTTFYLNYLFSGMDPLSFRIVNTAILALVSVIVVVLIRIVLGLPGPWETLAEGEKYGISVCVGLVYLIHPLQAYVTLYIWQRMTVLAYLFFLGSLVWYLSARAQFISASVGYPLCLLSFVLAVLSKESAVTLPAVLLVFELCFFSVDWKSFAYRALVLGVILVAVVAMISLVEHPHGQERFSGGVLATIQQYYEESGLTLWQVILTQSRVIVKYVSIILIPSGSEAQLMAPQVISSSIFQPPATLAALVAIVGSGLMGMWLLFKRPLAGIGILFYLINVLPDSLLVPQFTFCGYRPVLGIAGIAFIAVDFVVWVLARFGTRDTRRHVKVGLLVLVVGYCVFLGSRTVQVAELWADKALFLQNAVAAFPWRAPKWDRETGSLILYALGSELEHRGRVLEAKEYLHRSLQLHPGHPVVLTELASISRAMGQVAQAETYLEEAVKNPVAFPKAFRDLGLLKLDLGKRRDAIRYLEIAFKLEPYDRRVVRALQSLGIGHDKGRHHLPSP